MVTSFRVDLPEVILQQIQVIYQAALLSNPTITLGDLISARLLSVVQNEYYSAEMQLANYRANQEAQAKIVEAQKASDTNTKITFSPLGE